MFLVLDVWKTKMPKNKQMISQNYRITKLDWNAKILGQWGIYRFITRLFGQIIRNYKNFLHTPFPDLVFPPENPGGSLKNKMF